jgi:hypothetical protein
MSDSHSHSLSIAAPADLLNAVPFFLGFHPTSSIVVLALGGPERRVGLTIRLDYPTDAAEHDVIANRLVHHLLDDGADAAVVVIYRDDVSERPIEPVVDALIGALDEHAIALHEALVVSGQRWWSLVEAGSSEGEPIPEFASSVVAAEHVLHGLPLPMESDDALRGSLAGLDNEFARTIAQACAARRAVVSREAIVEGDGARIRAVRRRHIEIGADAVDRIFASWIESEDLRSLNVEDMALMMIGMIDVHVRDYAMGMHSDAELQSAFDLWRSLLPLAPAGCVAPIATVLAAVAFESGDGVLAQRAIDCAFDDRMNYPMAALLRQAMEAGWAPSAMTSMRKDLRAAVVATVRAA